MRWPKTGLVRTISPVANDTKCVLWVGHMIRTCSRLRTFAHAILAAGCSFPSNFYRAHSLGSLLNCPLLSQTFLATLFKSKLPTPTPISLLYVTPLHFLLSDILGSPSLPPLPSFLPSTVCLL